MVDDEVAAVHRVDAGAVEALGADPHSSQLLLQKIVSLQVHDYGIARAQREVPAKRHANLEQVLADEHGGPEAHLKHNGQRLLLLRDPAGERGLRNYVEQIVIANVAEQIGWHDDLVGDPLEGTELVGAVLAVQHEDAKSARLVDIRVELRCTVSQAELKREVLADNLRGPVVKEVALQVRQTRLLLVKPRARVHNQIVSEVFHRQVAAETAPVSHV